MRIKILNRRNQILALILIIALTALAFSCSLAGAQTASPLPPGTAITPTLLPPTQTTSPSLLPPPTLIYPPANVFGTPSATVANSPISPSWTAPALNTAVLPADLSDLAAKLLPSVVSINVNITSTNFMGQPSTEPAAGSGWVIDSKGLIVTNNHVVASAENITVSLSDGRTFPAQQVVADPVTDLAVIKIEATGLQAATVGDSSKLKPGMMVMAIGNALGEGLSVTAGWVGRTGVSITLPETDNTSGTALFGLIEMSVPINPGNSGGPLIDMLGEVVGITNAKLVATGVENVGYAISSKSAMPIIQELIQTGQIIRPYLGVNLQDIDPAIASVYDLAVGNGALITDVATGSPADNAGLKPGDVIVLIDNQAVNEAADAVDIIRSAKIGQTVTITYFRGKDTATAQATLIQRPTATPRTPTP